MATAALQQIVDAAVEHLAQGRRAGGLLQMPEQGGVAMLKGAQLQGDTQAGEGFSITDRPTPEAFGALGLEAVFPEKGQAVVIEAGGRGDPAHRTRNLVNGLPQ